MQTFLFDLDNTLYPSTAGVTDALEAKMNAYVAALTNRSVPDAAALRQGYFVTYGTTLRGLQLHHDVDTEAYLAAVHDIPIDDLVAADPQLMTVLTRIHQRSAVFTNSPREHAVRVMDALGNAASLLPIVDIRAIHFQPKPNLAAYEKAFELLAWEPKQTVFFEDTIANLRTAKTLGMQTVYIRHHQHTDPVPNFVDAVFDDIVTAISSVIRG